ncbi:hypothetical protein FB451DRAFT_1236919 [Mycena latifolia]|nr:hypothetical protein FB451DRAFT_1236919 [Mycena latifolia]
MSPNPNRVLIPIQPRAVQDDTYVPLKPLQTSRSLRWNLLVSDSANLSRADEDTTLCYVPRSEYDLTACASVSSGLKMKDVAQLPSFGTLSLPELPEIPDWHEDEQPSLRRQALLAALEPTEAVDSPQSDYHSLADFHPASLCCQDVPVELHMKECNDIVSQVGSPSLANFKDKPEPPSTVPAASHGRGRPRIVQHSRRSYSLDLADRRPADLTCTIPLDAGWGYGLGLGSPFCPSPLSSVAHLGRVPTNADLDFHSLPNDPAQYTSPRSLTAHPNVPLHVNQTPLSLRRAEALAVWRPQGPIPPTPLSHPDSDSLSDWDAVSLEQPFPSTASIWVLDAQAPSGLAHSASWPLHRPGLESRHRARGDSEAVGYVHKWSLEEQITISVLEAMDLRDMRSAGRGACSRLGVGSRKGKVRRLLARIWKRDGTR